MKIISLQYEDLSTGWKLDLTEFNPQLTLLVGVSGVGKTKILKALLNLKEISRGGDFAGLKWEIVFKTNKGTNYKWCGEFEAQVISGTRFSFEELPLLKFNNVPTYYEQLFIDGDEIVNRNCDGIFFEKNKTVKLPQDKSIIYLLSEEEQIKDAFESFEKIVYESVSPFHFPIFCTDNDLEHKLKIYKNIDSIRNSKETIKNKLFLCYKNSLGFDYIESAFTNIFPNIEAIVVDTLDSIFGSIIPSIAIKEKGTSHWIHQDQISSGMFQTLMQISELYLCPDGTVILIDEFENSLGINCIDEVTYQILASERDLQFIITSHHPYIINNIDYKYWKIVTRNGSVVKAEDATKYGIGRSKHEAFTQLINLDAYSEGIAS